MIMLIVDDERHVREGLRFAYEWEKIGIHKVLLAADGDEAMVIAKRERPEILVTDIRMQHMDGISLTEKIREMFPEMKCYLMTGYQEFDYAFRAIRLGVDNFFLKPLDISLIVKMLSEATEQLQKPVSRQQHLMTLTPELKMQVFSGFLAGRICAKDAEKALLSEIEHSGVQIAKISFPLSSTAIVSALPAEWIEQVLKRKMPTCLYTCLLNGHVFILLKSIPAKTAADILNEIRTDFLMQYKQDFSVEITPSGTLYDFETIPFCAPVVPQMKILLPIRNAVVQKIVVYIDQNLQDETLSLKRMSEEILYLSAGYVGKLMKKELGMSFPEYLAKMRIQRAVLLLTHEPTLKTQSLAQLVGMGLSPGYFSTLFKKNVGLSPNEFAQHVRARK